MRSVCDGPVGRDRLCLIGTISFELSGHLHNTVTDYAAYFDAAVRISARCAGLDVPGS